LAFQPYCHCLLSIQPQPSSCLRCLYQAHYHVSPPYQVCHTCSPSQNSSFTSWLAFGTLVLPREGEVCCFDIT
jgi:hypothetical protein